MHSYLKEKKDSSLAYGQQTAKIFLDDGVSKGRGDGRPKLHKPSCADERSALSSFEEQHRFLFSTLLSHAALSS